MEDHCRNKERHLSGEIFQGLAKNISLTSWHIPWRSVHVTNSGHYTRQTMPSLHSLTAASSVKGDTLLPGPFPPSDRIFMFKDQFNVTARYYHCSENFCSISILIDGPNYQHQQYKEQHHYWLLLWLQITFIYLRSSDQAPHNTLQTGHFIKCFQKFNQGRLIPTHF